MGKTVSKGLHLLEGRDIPFTSGLAFCFVSVWLRPKKKICVFPVTRPTLIFPSDPKVFIGIPKK